MSRHPAHDPSRQPAPMHDAAMLAAAGTIYRMAEINRILRSVTAALEKLMHLASGRDYLTLMHCLVLAHLSRSATCKQVDLKSATGIAPAHLTRLVDELVHQGLVGRHRSSWDRRQLNLALTAQGRETALHLLVSLKGLTDQIQLDTIEQLGSSLEQFASSVHDGQLNSKSPGG